MKRGLLKLVYGLAIFSLSQSSMAALLDITNSSLLSSLTSAPNGYRGVIDGIGFTLTSTDGNINLGQRYDGSARTGCQSTGGALKCDKDGAGIIDDEITGLGVGNQTLTLSFDREVNIGGFHFLDLYVNPNGSGAREQATITVDGVFFDTVDATGLNGDGGYAYLLTSALRGQTLEFTAALGSNFWDDHNNDYALAGVEVSAVPLPPAALLFGTAVAGLFGVRRSRKQD